MKQPNRVKVDGIWYVREDSLIKERGQTFDPDELTFYLGCVYENDTSCFQFEVLQRDNGELYAPHIDYTDKRVITINDRTDYWDNNDWFNGLIQGNKESLDMLGTLNRNDVNSLIEFLKIIKEKGWF